MKKLIYSTILCLPFMVGAQQKVDRSKAPNPGPAPKIKINIPPSQTLANGLKIYVVPNNKLPKVSAFLTLDINPFVEGKKSGTADIAGSLLSHGTKTKTKAQIDDEIDFLGAEFGTSSTSANVGSLSSNFEKAFALFADVVLNPAFPKDEMEKIRKQSLSGIEAEKDNPTAIAQRVKDVLVYGKNHPYGESTTEETVKSITLDDVKNFYKNYWKPNAGYLVFVGDISSTKALALANKYFGSWKQGVVPAKVYETPKAPAKSFVAIVDRPSAVQSVIHCVSPIQLQPGSVDAIPADVMNNILGASATARLFMNLREKHGFTYGAYSSVKKDKYVGAFDANASVRNEKTDSAIAEFINEFKRIRAELVPNEELDIVKKYLNGSFSRSLESPSTVANFALNIARYKLNPSFYNNYLTTLAGVNSEAVKKMANKFVTPDNMIYLVIGNAKEVSKGLEKYGEIKYFDIYGNETAAPQKAKAADAAVTPEVIFNKCIQASGGAEVLAKIKDLSISGTASVMGQDLSYIQKYIPKKAYTNSISFQGMDVMKQSIVDGTCSITQQGMPQEVKDKDKEDLIEESYIVGELYYLEQKNLKTEVVGIEQVDGKDAYAVKISTEKGREFTNYYDVKTGLKVKKTATEDDEKGGKIPITTEFLNYKSFDGIVLPETMKFDQGGLKINIKVTAVKQNTGLGTGDF